MSKTAKIWSTKTFAFPSGNTAAYLINSFKKDKRTPQNFESGWRSSYISNILLIPSVPDGLSSMKPLKEMHVLTWIINMFCWTRQNWPSTMKKVLNIWISLKSLELDLFKLLPEPLLHLLLAFLCFRTQEGHILFCQGVATFKILGMMIGSFQKGTKAILIALFSLCWKYNYCHIQQSIILIFLKTIAKRDKRNHRAFIFWVEILQIWFQVFQLIFT